MSRRPVRQRAARRLPAVTAAALAAVVALAGPASAHVEVEAAGARALAVDVTLDFSAATESDKEGVTALEVILPEGITPADVSYGKGPQGWTFAATRLGYKVSGPETAPGETVAYSVTVRQLPYLKSLAFKTLQTYGDGRVERWIDSDPPADGGHGNPAPVLALLPPAPGATPVGAAPGPGEAPADAPAADRPAELPQPTAPAGAAGHESGGANPVLVIGFVAAVLALVGGIWWMRRPRPAGRT